ncbi:MAG: exopolysaccharide biosynthesis protein, partial [Hyphomicrobiaceae bacterium]
IPFGNWLPAFSSALLGLALIERDGILFAIGTLMGVVSLAVIAAVFGSATALIGVLWTSNIVHF